MKTINSDFKWSFSKLDAFHACPMQFYLQYLQDPPLPKQQNAWAEFGILCHALLEEYAKGTLDREDLALEYAVRYPSVVKHAYPPYPAGYSEKAYDQGLRYFEQFNGFGEQYEVVSAEERFATQIRGHQFVGISDLTLRDRQTGGLIVVDHKTKSETSMKSELSLYRRQLYLYAEHVRRKYGEYPELLRFNMIKTGESIDEQFSPERHRETLEWMEDTISDVILEFQWTPKPKQYYCRFICGVMPYCDAGMEACKSRIKKNQ